MKYDFTAIEKKWQEKWLEEKPFTAVTGDKTREKFYGLGDAGDRIFGTK